MIRRCDPMSASPSQTPGTTAASARDESLASVLVALAANTAIAAREGDGGRAHGLAGAPGGDPAHRCRRRQRGIPLYRHSAQPAPRGCLAPVRLRPGALLLGVARRDRHIRGRWGGVDLGRHPRPPGSARARGVLGRGRRPAWSPSSWTRSAASSRCASCAPRLPGARCRSANCYARARTRLSSRCISRTRWTCSARCWRWWRSSCTV